MTPTLTLLLSTIALPSSDAPEKTPNRDHERAVLSAVTRAAEDNAKLPKRRPGVRGPYRKEGDELTELLFRAGARAALQLPEKQRIKAFLVGIGIALDTTASQGGFPILRATFSGMESKAERKKRLAWIGKPTMHKRGDWMLHFTVSLALRATMDEKQVEGLGLSKELYDALPGGSGFSFTDLNADLAGISLANRLLDGTLTLERLQQAFTVNAVLPGAKDLEDGLSGGDFRKKYESIGSARFLARMEAMRKNVKRLHDALKGK